MSAKYHTGGNINAELDPDHYINTSSSHSTENSGEKQDSQATKTDRGLVQHQRDIPQKRKIMMKRIVTTSFVLLGLSIAHGYADVLSDRAPKPRAELPPQAVLIEPSSFAVLPDNFSFRTDSSNQHFNPTNATPPIFQVFNEAFLDILGSNASIAEIASNATFAFAHEAPVWNSNLNRNNMVFKLSLADAEKALQGSGGKAVNVPITHVPLDDSVQMTNGGTGLFRGNIVLANSGRGPRPPNVVLVNPQAPNNVTYGFVNRFRDAPLMENHVYRLDPDTGAVRVVATDFDKPNGLAFTADGRTAMCKSHIESDIALHEGNILFNTFPCCSTDTGTAGGSATEPATIYAFDVDPTTHAFTNRRILAYVDAGIADGVQVDTEGNVYGACADGIHVFAPDGTLLGKIFTNVLGANLVFAPPNRVVILAETKIFLAKIAAKGVV
ncbi:hypothetical protein D9756_011583 [Leucocoprinus leucothites]|uniref:SMP-30/Gluconolactonase/LRE-like region domain-containing protein n=1 Tax=Leucocoprinus leucothites TaxID=201217 RepID=A0A8H5CLH7_9AGAR|nr:hypothetical protein D9756_011583 [Leucoagaricus leucothites]